MGRDGEARGFTIIELMVVITIIVILALLAVPSMISARLTANETAVIETLRSICTAQCQFRQSGKADEDFDSVGEYGGIGELSGKVGVRGGTAKVPTDLTASMRNLSMAGEIEKSGYIYRIYLPDASGEGVRENPGGGYTPGMVDPDLSEIIWCCYAWPANYGISGRRTFHVNAGGEITFTERAEYTGKNCPTLLPGSAYLTSNANSITGRLAVGTTAFDGRVWKPVQ